MKIANFIFLTSYFLPHYTTNSVGSSSNHKTPPAGNTVSLPPIPLFPNWKKAIGFHCPPLHAFGDLILKYALSQLSHIQV